LGGCDSDRGAGEGGTATKDQFTTTTIPRALKACTGRSSRRPEGTQRTAAGPVTSSTAPGIIIHGPAHRGANGAAMSTDEDDQDGHFFFINPRRGLLLAA